MLTFINIRTKLFIGLASFFVVLGIVAYLPIANSKPSQLPAVQTVLPNDIQWRDNLSLNGIQTANVIGDPSKSELYVLLSKMPANAILSPHTHPDNRVTTVLSGIMYYGTGTNLDSSSVRSYPAGSIIYTPADTSHFMLSKDEETILQHTGIGPTEISFFDK